MFDFGSMNVITVFWAAIVLIVFVISFFRYRERASHHRMVETLAEKGQTIPPEMLSGNDNFDRSMRYGNVIGSGIFLMCIGVALAVFFWALGGGGNFFNGTGVPNWLPVIGIFPFMTGLARVIGYLVERPRAK
jgi:sterol desaturase/sphingolipid hydroxylase (fatty acid hydroxylase superfamily)